MDRDIEPMSLSEICSPVLSGPWHINATISGTVVSDRPDYRPPARTPSRIDEDALTGITRALPGGEPR